MTARFVLLIHLLGFGMLAGSTFAGWVLNGRFSSETEPEPKLAIGRAMRSVSLLLPVAAILLLVTGIALIYFEYTLRSMAWLGQWWLVVKVVLFGILFTNGTILGPSIARKRFAMIQGVLDGEQELIEEAPLNQLNAQMRWFYAVQTILLIGIVSFSLFGPSNHLGAL